MERCTRCILPRNYPGITFNKNGICNQCSNHNKIQYLGGEVLKSDIEKFLGNKKDRNKDYDCLLGVSGGRDSTYLMYYLSNILNLKVVAYTTDNGFFTPEQARLNMKNAANILGMKLVIEKNDLVKRCYKHAITSWMRRPSLQMVETFCTGCRHPVIKGMIDYGKKNRIPIIVRGGTPFEVTQYKYNIMKINIKPESQIHGRKSRLGGANISLISGYLSNVVKNPRWFMNRDYVATQFRDYYYLFREKEMLRNAGFIKIRPFANYIRWIEKDVISIIENELKWEKNPISESTWRGDCDIAFLKLYVYNKILGFNDKIDSLSHLIRDNQITREEALERLEKEVDIPDSALDDIFQRIGLNRMDFENAVSSLKKMEGKNNF